MQRRRLALTGTANARHESAQSRRYTARRTMHGTIGPMSTAFWSRLDAFLESGNVVIDRPAQSHHPRFPSMIYPLDYGYLEPVTGDDGQPIDTWRG